MRKTEELIRQVREEVAKTKRLKERAVKLYDQAANSQQKAINLCFLISIRLKRVEKKGKSK